MGDLLNNPLLIALIIIAILLIFISINFLLYANRKIKHVDKENTYKNIYYSYIDSYSDDMCMLLRSDDLYPLFVSNNVSNVGLSEEIIRNDLEIFGQYVDPKDIRKFKEELKKWDKKEPFNYDAEYHYNNDYFYSRLIIKLTDDKKYYLVCLHDITLEHFLNIEKQQELERVIADSKNKSELLSQMSHEIRTPMNGIIGMLDLAQADNELGQAKVYIGQAQELSDYLLGLINDILDMARLENNKVELIKDTFDIREFLAHIDSIFKRSIESRGITYISEIADFDEYYVVGDNMRLSQVITNFLSNAQKFTPKNGTIRVTFKQLNKVDDHISLMLRVSDTGKGMSNEFLSRIFHPFEQENVEIAKNYGGTGLGMAIADSLIKLMDGQIVVDSELGKGSDFSVYLTLPYVEKEEVKETTVTRKNIDLTKVKVLLAEDNDINAIISTRLLNNNGIKVVRAIDGQDVVDKFAASDENEYRIILMDINMPKHNGREAAQLIRQLDRKDAKEVIIIAASADAYEEDKKKSIECGMDGHVSKPFTIKDIKKIVE